MNASTEPDTPPQSPATVADELLEVLVCPVTRSPLPQQGAELVAEVGGLRYPIRDGIPVLLAEEAALPDGFTSLDEFKRQHAADEPARPTA